MQYQFYMKPIVFDAPLDPNKKYIVGMTNAGWVPYTPEIHAEIMRQWEEYEKNKPQVKLLVDQEPEEFKVKSNSDPNKSYIVKKHPDGSWTCDCPGYGYRRKCSHIEKMKGKS